MKCIEDAEEKDIIRKELQLKGGVLFLVTGGIAYTIGSILYGLGKKKKWMHSIFHLFIIAGSVLHFFEIRCVTDS